MSGALFARAGSSTAIGRVGRARPRRARSSASCARASRRSRDSSRTMLMARRRDGGGCRGASSFALLRIRRPARAALSALAAAVAIGVGYARFVRDRQRRSRRRRAVSLHRVRAHHSFSSTGLARRSGDGSVLVDAGAGRLLVGTCEEWLQWFIPARVGEVRDVLLNLVAIAMRAAVQHSASIRRRCAGARLAMRRVAARGRWRPSCVVRASRVSSTPCISGTRLRDRRCRRVSLALHGRASSRDSARSVRAMWQTDPPLTWSRCRARISTSAKASAHVQRRNEAGTAAMSWRRGTRT